MRRLADADGEPERQALSRTRRAISLRIAVVLSLAMLFIGAVVFTVMRAAENASINRELSYATHRSQLDSPPGCAWLVERRDARVAESPGIPAGFPLAGPMDAVAAGHRPVIATATVRGTTYRTLTLRRGDEVVQAVYDVRFQARDRDCLLMALGAAELLGAAGAVAAGSVLAGRAMAPLGEALGHQRRFVADASHELRTPLTRLHTRAQLLARGTARGREDDSTVREAARIVAGTKQLGDIIDDLLLSTRVQVGPADFAAVDLAALAEEARAQERDRAAGHGLEITVVRERGPHAVAGGESALRRVVTALVDNAVGHTPPGGRIVLTVGAAAGGTVRLSVRDTGLGFEPGRSEQIFERFARGTEGRGPRHGIGLSLVHEIVTGHHGTIEAAGAPGRGAVFTMTLPAWPTGRPRRGPRAGRRLPVEPAGAPRPNRVARGTALRRF